MGKVVLDAKEGLTEQMPYSLRGRLIFFYCFLNMFKNG